MSETPVPVSMGSPSFRVVEGDRFLCTLARFPTGAYLPPHVHDRPTFAVILEGGFDLQFTSPGIRRKRLPCTAGTVFVEPAGERHANAIAGSGASVVVLQPETGNEELWGPFTELLGCIQHFRHGPVALDARRLATEVRRPDELTPLSMEALALRMLVEAGRRPDAGRDGRRPGWLERVDEYVHETFRDAPRIADVAEVAGVHPSHLASVFRDAYGVPLGEYLRRLRAEWCAERLAGRDRSLSEIAYAAGYADQSHFTREFKRWTGWTPAAYRAARRS